MRSGWRPCVPGFLAVLALLTGCGTGGVAGGGALPELTFTASPGTIAQGGSSTLNWTVTGATSATIDQGVGAVGATGDTVVSPADTTTYTLSATNDTGTSTATATVTVNAAGVPVVVSFTATPGSITVGDSSLLAWDVTGASSVSLDHTIGTVGATSQRSVSPTATTTYALSATNGAGTVTATATVTVNPVGAPVIVSFTATPGTVTAGNASVLAWSVTGASSVSIDHAVGTFGATGQTSVSPTATTTYTLSATNGTGTSTATATVTVTPVDPPVIVSFTATPDTIASGDSSTLAWEVTGATTVRINRTIGTVSATGQRAVSPTSTTSYTLSAINNGGTVTQTVTVTVLSLPAITSFTAAPTTISSGGASQLSWTVTGSTSVSIDNGVGTFGATGQTTVTPSTTTTYTLSTTNGAGTSTATATVTVSLVPVVVSFTASPRTITGGGSSTLAWSVTGSTSVSIDNGVGVVGATGQTTVMPADTTTYTLSATNGSGTTTATATITIAGTASAWLYTKAGDNHIYTTASGTEAIRMGRGVNLDDLSLCGYNGGYWMTSPTAEDAILTLVATMMSDWQPTFVRISLSMKSYTPTVSWTANPSQYRDPMTHIIDAIGAYPGVYVLVTLRSDASMSFPLGDEATCVPTTATDAVYQALVDSFQDSPFVIFGVANEPGGNTVSNTNLRTTMSHAVDVIRAEEDLLGKPHHLVAVQGNSWTSAIGFYDSAPLTQDNVIYEVHGYPPTTASYTYAHIPVFIGEAGPANYDENSTLSASFFTDVESKYIPNLAWDLDPYSDCAPDVVQINHSPTTLNTTTWGAQVKTYLLAH